MQQTPKHIYTRWVDAWNGDFTAIADIIANDFVFHREHGQPDITGPQAFRDFLQGSLKPFTGLTFTTQLGPLCEGDMVVGRNTAQGTYAGGLPGATAPDGTAVSLTGIDILRIANGKIVECWHNGNDLAFMLQLGAVRMAQ